MSRALPPRIIAIPQMSCANRIAAAVAVAAFMAMCTAFARAAEPQPIVLRAGIHPLIDRTLIDKLDDALHTLHSPVRRDVVLVMDRPWEGIMSGYGVVMRDDAGRVRLYYRGGGDVDPPEVTCVAFSDDGVTFTRPALRLYDIRGTRDNNVVFTADRKAYGESHNFAPFLDSNPAAGPDARWKAVALKVDRADDGEDRKMLTVLASPDGLRWKHLSDKPVIRRGGFDSLNIAFFDRAAGQYVCYFRVGVSGMRSFARARSNDFLAWTIDDPLTFHPRQDEQWYTNGVTPYPDVERLYLAMPMRFVPQRKTIGDPPRQIDGLSDAALMSSRNGITWDRTFRSAFIRPGPEPGNWGDAHGNNTPLAGIIETSPGEWSVYWMEGYGTGVPRIRRGTLRAHGIASVRADADGGAFTTPPLRLHDSRADAALRLNFATSAAGSIRVEILAADGKPLDGFAASACAELFGDEPARIVTWSAGARLPRGDPFRLRFILRDADLYAIIVDGTVADADTDPPR